MTGFQVPPGVGEEDAPFNTVEWAKSVRTGLLGHCYDLPKAAQHVASYLGMLRETRGWEHLNKPDGSAFTSLEEFCAHRHPWGLGMKLADLERWISSNGPATAPLYWNPENGEHNTETPEVWPEADLFPMLDDAALAKLAEDIKANGLREPIVLWKGRVLDGRNRLKACGVADVPPTFKSLASCPSPAAYVVSANLHRRHLSESQRIALAVELLPMFREEARGRQRAAAEQTNAGLGRSETLPANLQEASGESVERAAAATKTKPRSVASGKKVKESGVPELFAMVKSGEVAVSAAAAVATLPEDEQREAVAGGKKAIQAKAKAVRASKAKPTSNSSGKGRGQASATSDEKKAPARHPILDEIDGAADLRSLDAAFNKVALAGLSAADSNAASEAYQRRSKELRAQTAATSEAPAPPATTPPAAPSGQLTLGDAKDDDVREEARALLRRLVTLVDLTGEDRVPDLTRDLNALVAKWGAR